MIVGARMKTSFDLALSIGWQAERFARTKKMRALAHYLKPEPAPSVKRDARLARFEAAMERMVRRDNNL